MTISLKRRWMGVWMRTFGTCLFAAAISGCAIQTEPLTTEGTAQRIKADLAQLAANRTAIDGPLTLHGAMARALLHNPDARVREVEHEFALKEAERIRRGLAPEFTGRYGVDARSNDRASSSRSVLTGRESLSASTSSDRSRRTGNLLAAWQMLDFGVSYYGAKQQTDRTLIADERRRKAAHTALADVRRAWWRAVAGERALALLEPLLERVREALADSERIAGSQVRAPIDELRYQRELLGAVAQLEAQRRDIRLQKIELSRLIGLPPGADYALAVPHATLEPLELEFDTEELAMLALARRPELREGELDERIAAREIKKAMLRMLPGIELGTGAHADSNSFLVNGDWLSLSAAITVNLTELYNGPAAITAARAGRDLAAARREALSMAVLAQLHIALARFETARTQYITATRIAEIELRIAEVLRSLSTRGAADRLKTIRAEIDALRALLARDLEFAEVEDSFGAIFLAIGADIHPLKMENPAPADIAAAIAATEKAWRNGVITPGLF